jgi:nucleoside-diphosphate-sugar epimerase
MAEEKQVLNIFVTDAGQGIGLAALTEAVRRGHKVVGATGQGTVGANRIRRAGGLPVYPDLTRESALYSALMMAKADVIINAAPQVLNGIPFYRQDYAALADWLKSSTNALIGAAGRADIKRIIQLSSALIYGDTHSEAVSEDYHAHGHSLLSRVFAEVEDMIFDGGIPVYALRTGYIYGSLESSAEVAKLLRAGKALPKGHHKTAWVHEDDVATAALNIAELEADKAIENIYNIAGDENLTLGQFIDAFGRQIGIGEPTTLSGFGLQFGSSAEQRELLEMGILLDTSKARNELNWKPQTSIDAGLDKMMLRWRAEAASKSSSSDSNLTGKELVKA